MISWKTKKQKIISRPSAEVEYRSMSQTTSEIVWIDGLLEDLHILIPKPITLHCDNKAAEHIAQNPVFHGRTKHLKLDCHYVRENVQSGFIQTSHVRSAMQLADLMTKALGQHQHNFLAFKFGLVTFAKLRLEGGGGL